MGEQTVLDEPSTHIKRISLTQGENLVGHGSVWSGGYTELFLLPSPGRWRGPNIRSGSFADAMDQARECIPDMDWDWLPWGSQC